MKRHFWFRSFSIVMLSLFSQISFAADNVESPTALLDTAPITSPIAPDKVLVCTNTSAQEPGQPYRWNYTLKMYHDYSFHLSGTYKGPYANDSEEIKGIGIQMDPTHPFPMRLYQRSLWQKFCVGTLLATQSLKTVEINFADESSTLLDCKFEDLLPH